MKKTSSLSFLLFSVLIGLLIFETSCDNAKAAPCACEITPIPSPTYDDDIAPIINSKCAVSGCHISGAGIPGVFPDYEGLSSYLNGGNNGFEDRVIIRMDMPQIGSGFDLTDDELKLLSCWVCDGYPEN